MSSEGFSSFGEIALMFRMFCVFREVQFCKMNDALNVRLESSLL